MNDETLWERIKQTIIPLNREDVLPVGGEKARRVKKKRAITPNPPSFHPPQALTKPYQSVPQTPLPFSEIDRKTQRKIDKGQMRIDGKLDLHGLTVSQAHREFNTYIRESAAQGRRSIIIVTGKGNPERGSGVIRRELPHWAESSEVSQYIHSLSEPVRNKGRYIVLLRKKRGER